MSIDDFNDRQASPDRSDSGLFPCTLLQERLWTQLETGGPEGLNVAMRWLVNGSLSQAAAEAALQSLVQRHEILRTGFCKVDGKLAQVVLPECPLKLRDIDLSFLPADESAARAEEIARAEALEPIDPGQAPLMRTTLLRLAPDRAVLLLTFHAMVADGWSTGLIAHEFRAAASAIGSGALPDTSEPELQFVDYALWQQALLESGALEEAQSFWQQQLQDAVGTEVPPDRPTPAPGDEPSHILSVLLPDDLSRTIESFARQQNVTLYTVAVAGLALMLHRVTGDTEIVVGSQVANREEPTAEQLVGPTVNAITLRVRVDDNAGARALVGTVADTVHDALRHQRLPFEIARKFAPHREGKPLHAINLVVHRSYSGTMETETEPKVSGHFSLVSLPSYSSGALWPLNFFMISRDEGWRLSCEADAALYMPATVQGLVEAWRHCLEALATGTDSRRVDDDATPAVDAQGAIPLRDPARHFVRFHENGSQTPVTVLNNRSVYYQLARALGEERPFIDIMLYPPDGPFDWSSYTFEEFGTYAMRLTRWAQPQGPYILGGHCVFGVLAFEVARQLQRLGEKVSLVALFDSWAPGYRETMSPRDQKLRKRQLRMNTYAERLGQYRRGEIGLNEIARKPILRRLGLIGPDPEPETLPGQWFDDHLREAAARYRPSPYNGRVVIFRSEETLRGRLFDEQMGWGPLVAGNLKKVEIASAHLDMFREQPAGEIAAVLRTR